MRRMTYLLSLTIVCGMVDLRAIAADAPATAAPKVPEGWLLGVELIEYRQQIDPKRLGLVSCAAIALTGRDG